MRAWDERNRPLRDADYGQQLFSARNPSHYYVTGHVRTRVGNRRSEPWLGENGCPAQCPGLRPGETYAPMEPFWRAHLDTQGDPHE